ncbi:MAG TPA: TonB-dependent receptor [Bacteroidales bacterium]|nr:TonB-dependent receptor [Bacteroidales bacterium]HPK29690.1 TonB-dependent receptor [Bacteroidales bacterium]
MKRLMTMLLSVMVLSVTAAFAQYTAKGVVVDSKGETIIGAAVIQVGTANGTQTGLDGDFVLTVPSGETMLEISFLGYKTVTITAAQASAARIVMQDDVEFLEEVVVIGYGTVKKSDMTGSVVAIKADEINRGAITSPDQMLLGKVSGLHVTPASGQPGASATIRIRGAASLNASNDPLIVIDGVPVTSDGGAGMGNPLASVNPNDIESYTVLKDASATAIYGSRASNGVIIITTKKGRAGARGVNVSYNSSYSVKQNASTIDMMDADTFRNFMQSTYANNNTIQTLLGNESTDWQKQIYRLAFNTDQAVSVYGATKHLPYRVSLGYNYDQATLKVGDNQKANVDISLSPKFFDDHLSINLNVKGIYQKTNWAPTGAVGSALSFDPTKPTHFTNADGSIDYSKVANGYWNWLNADGSANTMAGTNPLSSLYDFTDVNKGLRSIGNLQVDYMFHGFEDLRFNLNLGYDIAKSNGEKFNHPGSISAMRSSLDLYTDYANYNSNTLLEAYFNYKKELGKSNLDVMAGYSWQHNYVRYDQSTYLNNEARPLYQANPTNAKEYYLISFFGRINYSLLGRYLFTATIREDASSRFSKANRWGFFPSVAFAWNVAEESFLKGSDAVSALKLRLGWGRTGQQDIGSDYYPYMARYEESSSIAMKYYLGTGYYTTLAPQKYNPNLKWETTETYNLGLDFGFMNDRITGSLEGYYRYTYDLLNEISTPLGSNFGNSIISNIGNMENKGVELSLNVIPVETSDMSLSIGGNVTLQSTKITKLTSVETDGYLGVTTGSGMGGTGGYTSLHRTGFAPFTFYLFQQLYDSQDNPIQNGLVDRDGDGVITDADRYVTGFKPAPDAYFGLNLKFRYKKWDFGFNGHGSFGNYIINRVAMSYASSYSDNWNKGYLDNLSNIYLVDGWTAAMENNQKYTDMFIENGSFFRMDDINLGYTFDKVKWVESIRLSASVQNVFVISKYRGLDPELQASDGVDSNIIPRPRLFTLRLNINF